MRLSERHGPAIARCQQVILAGTTAVPNRTDGVNDVRRGKAVPAGDLGVAGRASIQGAALREQFGSGGTMDRAVDTAATE